MGLPTPPNTAHREEKENRWALFPTASRVVWSDSIQYHTISVSSRSSTLFESSASRLLPRRSILKKTVHVLPPIQEEFQKEATPEPSDPLVNLHYLDGPVSRILAADASMTDLIKAYTVLTARLRTCVPGNTDADASWPLFQPLRYHREAFVDALVRDLERALVDPTAPSVQPKDEPVFSLPSPKQSPKKKRSMSGEEAKDARDLCMTCQAVMKLLAVVFTLPAVYQIFTDAQLGFVLTQVLAIPLANELPTQNARKTNALAIWLLLTQRLPPEILAPAKDRIAYALRRGIEGELGKEGKKGSASDGLRAIHDLSTTYPALFVPAFTELLPSVLANLLAPTLALRIQACHALGGFAYATASLPPSPVLTRISELVAAYLTRPTTTSDKLHSPTQDLPIIRTLRTTLNAPEAAHAAQGPVWAWCVLAAFIVLLGPTLFVREKLTTTMTALLSLGMRHPKSTVRAIGCMAWHGMTWAYFRPLAGLEGQSEEDEEDAPESEEDSEAFEIEDGWKIVQDKVELGTGIAMIGALLGREPGVTTDELSLKRTISVLRSMMKKGGRTFEDALEITLQLVDQEPQKEWDMRKLLAPGLFSANPGLLTAQWNSLPQVVRPLLEDCPQPADVRSLTRDELTIEWVFNGLLQVWRAGLSALRLYWPCEIPAEIGEIWTGLLSANVAALQDAGDEEATAGFAGCIVNVLVDILRDRTLDISADSDDGLTELIPTSDSRPVQRRVSLLTRSRWNLVLKLVVIRELWTIARTIFPRSALSGPAEKLLMYLDRHESDLVDDMDLPDDIRKQWAYLCAEVAFVCDVYELKQFWGRRSYGTRKQERNWSDDVRCLVWRKFVNKLSECSGTWEAAVVLLGVPFVEANSWEMSTEDLETWNTLLRTTMDNALDYGVDSVSVVDLVSSLISSNHAPTLASSTRVADLLLSHLEIGEARQIPFDMMEFINDTLISTYPPEPRNKVFCMWLLRSLTRVIDACPVELSLNLLETLQEGLVIWIADDYEVFTPDGYSMDILPMYQTLLLGMQSLPSSLSTLESIGPLLESAFSGREDNLSSVSQTFDEFWQASYAQLPRPRQGWPEKIENCLAVISGDADLSIMDASLECIPPSSFLLTDAAPGHNIEEVDDTEKYLSPLEDVIVEPLSALLPAFCGSLIPAVAGLSDAVSPPSTPKSSQRPLPLTIPTRPQKPSGQKDLVSIFFKSSSPVLSSPTRSLLTPRRSPHSGSRHVSSSVRRHGLHDKENATPLRAVPSVAERIAMVSPCDSSTLGKRHLTDEVQEEKAPKRRKLEVASVGPILGEITVNSVTEDSDIPQDSSVRPNTLFETSQVQNAGCLDQPLYKLSGAPSGSATKASELGITAIPSSYSKPSKKRKGVFLDAVEVPTFSEVLRLERQRPCREPRSCSQLSRTAALANESRGLLRRTRSATKLLGDETTFLTLDCTPCKKRKSSTLRIEPIPSTSRLSPLVQVVLDGPIVGSDDSIMLASPTKPNDLSSDDDPHVGQVTPLGLVSPAIRRVRGDEFDLSSDDSVMPASPSRDRVARRIARLPERSSVKLTPMGGLSSATSGSSLPGYDA
ncbi:hypothetical protein BKA93DRAFT_736024 [Sparassis latifolia]